MDAQKRRIAIEKAIQESDKPISASTLAKQFHVSRQIVVGDVALLRASGSLLVATPRGYVHQSKEMRGQGILYTIVTQHSKEQLAEELYTIIDLGGTMLDVIVEHPLYGELQGQLHLQSRYDVEQFLHNMKKHEANPLCNLTNGLHLHTIRVQTEDVYERIIESLDSKGFLYKK